MCAETEHEKEGEGERVARWGELIHTELVCTWFTVKSHIERCTLSVPATSHHRKLTYDVR